MTQNLTHLVNDCLAQMKSGDPNGRKRLLECSCDRLRQLASQMLGTYSRVRRWEDTDDVLANAMIRLNRSLESVTPETPLHYFRLAALQIRRELVDLSRHYFGPQGMGAHHATVDQSESQMPHLEAVQDAKANAFDPVDMATWSELHEKVGKLPDEEREVFELHWYHQISQTEIADLLDVSRRTVIRRWQAACLKLHQSIFSEDSLSQSDDGSRKES